MPDEFSEYQIDRIIATVGRLPNPDQRPALADRIHALGTELVGNAQLWASPSASAGKLEDIEKRARKLLAALPSATMKAPREGATPVAGYHDLVTRRVYEALFVETRHQALSERGYASPAGDDGTRRFLQDALARVDSSDELEVAEHEASNYVASVRKEIEALAERAQAAQAREQAVVGHGGSQFSALQVFVDGLLMVLWHFFGRAPKTSTTISGEVAGPSVRFVSEVLKATRENLTDTDLSLVPDLPRRLELTGHAVRERIRNSPHYRMGKAAAEKT
jgi:hypothetical protein